MNLPQWEENLHGKGLPLETPIVVKHKHGIEAIHFWYGAWRYWYTGWNVDKEVLHTITHYMITKFH